MEWTRRHFMYALGGFLALIGGGLGLDRTLRGSLEFEDWRALPGMKLGLTVAADNPGALNIDIIAYNENGARKVAMLGGAPHLEIDIPYVATREESYTLVAEARDWRGRSCRSETVEVIARPYQFGL